MELSSAHTPFSATTHTQSPESKPVLTQPKHTMWLGGLGAWGAGAPGCCCENAKGCQKQTLRPANHCPQSSREGRATEVVLTCNVNRCNHAHRNQRLASPLLYTTWVPAYAGSGCLPRSAVPRQPLQSQPGPFSTTRVSNFERW